MFKEKEKNERKKEVEGMDFGNRFLYLAKEKARDLGTEFPEKEMLSYANNLEEKRKNKEKHRKIIEEIEKEIEEAEFILYCKRNSNVEKNKIKEYVGNEAQQLARIERGKKQIADLIRNDVDAYEFFFERQIKRDIIDSRANKLINVDYVNRFKKKVIKSFYEKIPVYICGHLGCGKTHMAIEAALEYSVKRQMGSDICKEIDSYLDGVKDVDKDELIQKFTEVFRNVKEEYDIKMQGGDKEELSPYMPLFISGTPQQEDMELFVDKNLYITQNFSEKTYAEYLNLVSIGFFKWINDNKEFLNSLNEEEKMNTKIKIWRKYSAELMSGNVEFENEIKRIETEIIKAIKEGRVVIIDELDTIAIPNLIALNNLFQKYIGKTAYVTGFGPVKIEEGFGIVGTGSVFKAKKEVAIDPNYVSKMNVLDYGEIEEKPEDTELFRIIVTRLLDLEGSLHLPEIKKNIQALFNLARFSRFTKENFASDEVMSIKVIFDILDDWNKGEKKNLSTSIWDVFIQNIKDKKERDFVFANALDFDFFGEEDGWTRVENKNIRNKDYKYEKSRIESLSCLDMIHILF